MENTTIKLSKETAKNLRKLKIVNGETYEEVIIRLIKSKSGGKNNAKY